MQKISDGPELNVSSDPTGLSPVSGQDVIKLLPPETGHGKSLMQALKERHTSREFSDKKLAPSVLSNLLWAAFGVNRSETGRADRTLGP